jgi:hypothetical protein
MPPSRPASSPRSDDAAVPGALACRVKLADGDFVERPLTPERHRAIQLGVLHSETAGLVELTPGTRGRDGTLAVDRRDHAEHYLAGGAGGHPEWLAHLLAHAEQTIRGAYARSADAGREEVFVGAAPRTRPRGSKDAVAAARFLWVDIDRPDRLDALWTFLSERPCHLLVETGGSGGVHAYWKLDRPLEPTRRRGDGTLEEPIERAHERLIHGLGTDADGRPDVGDPRCAERSRVLRLGGTVNHKSGNWARVISADLALAPYPLDELLDGLPEPPNLARRIGKDGPNADPYKRIAPAEYFLHLAGLRVPARGLVSCPVPGHEDAHPSCSVGRSAEEGWCCHAASCGARGAIYDLASVLAGGPWGPALRGEHFARARQAVVAAFGDLTAQRVTDYKDHADRDDAGLVADAPRPGAEPLWVVHVDDHIDPRIAGHGGSRYVSPPQPREDAITLIAMLLGGPVDADATRAWSRPVAGGRRTVSLEHTPA